ncbi:MAG: DNA polymerase I [Gammaproteobacteria bacterium]|nr:DNA polymerase I [Gammaproteobacteria bacterium]
MARKHLVLIDGSSCLYRAYHALPPLTTSRGQPTGAIHGVIAMLRRLLREHEPGCVAVVMDAPGRTFRDDLYAAYKAQRPPMPDDLRAQLAPLRTLVRALGLPLLEVSGVEADDVIGTLAVAGRKAGMSVLISTNDKDMAQLVGDGVSIVNSTANEDRLLDRAGVEAKFGVPPERIVDYLALIGDSVDNVPGVPQVGPKTASKWLQQYGSLDALIVHAGEIGGKVGESLRKHLDQLPLARELITIRVDVPLDCGPQDLQPVAPDRDALRALYTELEFKTWLAELLEQDRARPEDASGDPQPERDYEAILDEAALEAWLERLRAAEVFAFDTETTSLDYVNAEIVGVSFAVEPGKAAYVPVAHDCPGAPAQLARELVLERLRPLLQDPARPKVGQNLKYDMSVLANHGIELEGIAFDTMLESYVLDSTATRHDMDSLALKYLGVRTIHFEDVAGKGASQIPFNEVPVAAATPYAAEDADITLQLHRRLWPRLAGEPGLRSLFETIEMPLVPVLSRVERNGVLIDPGMLSQHGEELGGRLAELEQQAHALAGSVFNIGSPKQIQEVLFDRLGLPVLEKTPKGQPSTAESVLEQLALDYPLPRLILEYRGLAKLKSTYADKLPLQVNSHTGRVHTSYHQAVAATGRLSSSDPNLQNIPVRTPEGRRIRQAFIAPPGHRLVAADYSQIELRIMAHLSADPRLLAAFAGGEDVHRQTAAEVFGVGPEQVSTAQRRAAKAINFGLMYGMSAFGLARQLGIDRAAAQQYVELYFSRYPGVKEFMEATRVRAREQGYVETLYGRRLYLPEINSRNNPRRQYAERTAINAPMQGSAADIIKRAMITVDAWLREQAVGARLIMQVHDELVFEVAEAAVEQVVAQVPRIMAAAAALAVPLVVDVGVGANWDEAH